MKFQETTNKFLGQWAFQAQFHDAKQTSQAKDWLEGRPQAVFHVEHNSIYTNDLQVIFELRIQFDHILKSIKQARQA